MSKTKKWLVFLASLTMVATLGVATACGDKSGSTDSTGSSPIETVPGDSTPGDTTPTTKTYTVTVVKPDGTPAANLPLNFCVGEECTPITTDANGVATLVTEDLTAAYHVEFKLPLDSMYEIYGFGYTELTTNPDQLTYTMNLTPLQSEPAAPVISEPLSGTGSWEDAYVIEAGKTYCAPATVQAENYSAYFVLASSETGTYTINLPEETTGSLSASIDGIYEEVVDGYSFSVKAGTNIQLSICCTIPGTEANNWQETYEDVIFSLSFDDSVYTESGSALAPYTLTNGTTYEVESFPTLYYTFTAPSDGQYKLTLNNWAADSENVNFYTADYDAYARGVATNIAAGETILFSASNYGNNTAAWTFSFGASLENDANFDEEELPPALDEEDNIHCITDFGTVEITVAANSDYYMSLDAANLAFIIPEGFTATATIEMQPVEYAAGEWVSFDNHHPMTNQNMYVTLTNTTDADVTITLNITTKPAV